MLPGHHPHSKHTHTQVESVEQAQLRAPLNGKHSQKQFYLMTSRFSSINSACVAVSCLLWINEELEGIKLIRKRLQKALKRAECCAAGSDFPDTPWLLSLSVAPALLDTHGPENKFLSDKAISCLGVPRSSLLAKNA